MKISRDKKTFIRISVVVTVVTVATLLICGYCLADQRTPSNPPTNWGEPTGKETGGGSYIKAEGCDTQTFKTVTLPDGTKFVETVGGTASLNCCREDHINCVRWICGSSADFTAAWKNGHRGGGYNNETVQNCMNSSGQVCWAGRVITDDNGFSGFDVWNEQNITRKGNLGNTYMIDSGMGMDSDTQARMNAAAKNINADTNRLALWCDDGTDVPTIPQEDEVSCGTLSLSGNQTGVISGVRKEAPDNYNWDNNGYVWARPGENVRFHDCYYSGLQNLKGEPVTPSNEQKSTYYAKGWTKWCPPGTDEACRYNTLKYETSVSVDLPSYTTLKADIDKNKGGWKQNGYDITGIINHSESFDNNAAANAYHYQSKTSDAIYTVTGDDVGKDESQLHQTITSKFMGGITTINIGSPEDGSWPCWPWWRIEEVPENSETYTKYKAPSMSASCNGDDEIVESTQYAVTCKHVISKATTKTLSGNSTCTADYPWISYSMSGHAEHTSGIRVPYNYENYGEALFDDTVIYSGEKTPRIWGWAINSPRYNARTRGTYATKAPNVHWGLVGYIKEYGMPGSIEECYSMAYCEVYEDYGDTLNANSDPSGERRYIGGGTYNLWDVEAGNQFCSTVMIFPSSSDKDENMTGEGKGWYIDKPNCRVISKKPTFQIHGPMYIESGTIEQGRIATKNNVAGAWGFNAYSNGTALEDSPNRTRNFYSWVDQSLTIGRKATVKRFATGAAVNVKNDNGGKNIGGIFSSVISDEIFRSRAMQPLTIPTPSVTPTNAALDGIGAVLNSSFKSTVVESAKRTASGSETCKVDGLSLDKNTDSGNNRRVIVCNGTLEINGDIIYASNGINIKSNVSRIDGWVIAEGTIDTCSDGGACNKSLTFNGTVLAHEIKLNRTYGAGAGKRSSYPAELFNLSSAAFMYSASEAKKNSSKVPQTVYLRELAPRY